MLVLALGNGHRDAHAGVLIYLLAVQHLGVLIAAVLDIDDLALLGTRFRPDGVDAKLLVLLVADGGRCVQVLQQEDNLLADDLLLAVVIAWQQRHAGMAALGVEYAGGWVTGTEVAVEARTVTWSQDLYICRIAHRDDAVGILLRVVFIYLHVAVSNVFALMVQTHHVQRGILHKAVLASMDCQE